MRRARAFFFVCLGVLCLVAAYHFGAQTARAQAGSGFECAGVSDGKGWAVVDHHLYRLDTGATTYPPVDHGLIPSPARAIACGRGVVLENGEYWESLEPGMWRLIGTFPFTLATAAQTMSMGQLKLKYATPRAVK